MQDTLQSLLPPRMISQNDGMIRFFIIFFLLYYRKKTVIKLIINTSPVYLPVSAGYKI